MKIKTLIGLLSCFVQLAAFGINNGDSLVTKYANSITAESLKAHLEIIASDAFEGRETGKPGQKLAANYIAETFEDYGLSRGVDTTYFQKFDLISSKIGSATIHVGSEEFLFLNDFYFFNGMNRNQLEKELEVHFLGFGIEDESYNDYYDQPQNIEYAIIWQDEPLDKNGNFLISGSELKSEWSKDFSKKLDLAKSKGIKTLFIINEDFSSDIGRYGYYLKSPKLGLKTEEGPEPELSVFYISPEMAKKILGPTWSEKKIKQSIAKGKEYKKHSVKANLSIDVVIQKDTVHTENIIGLIEGSELKNEFVIITAHYDHLGKKDNDIYNGADDDGSGTTAIIEIARALSDAKKDGFGPKRSVVIMPVSGEEKGLLGSEYYAANPVFPLNQTVANLNVDMIGRTDDAHAGNSSYVYLIGSNRLSTNLHYLSEEVNTSCCGLFLDYTYNDPNDPNRFYYRSDHYNFIKNGIPAIFYFSGVHEDYHRPTDTVEKIEFDKMAEITRLIFHTAWEIANSGVDLTPDVIEPEN